MAVYSKEAYMDALSGNAPLRDKISKRYLDAVRKTAILYDTAKKDIRDSYKEKRGALGAQAALAKSNAALDMSQKGLSRSGQSVQNSLLSDMALNSGIAQLGAEESRALNELSMQRQQAMNTLQDNMARELNEADKAQKEQDYKKQRDAVADEKWETEFKYKASQDSVKSHQWEREFDYKKQQDSLDRQYTHERDEVEDRRWQEENALENDRWEREFARSNYENDRDHKLEVKKQDDKNSQLDTENELARDKFNQQTKKENSETAIKNAYLALERDYKEREMKLSEDKVQLSYDRIISELDIPYRITEEGYILPLHTPDEFIDIMIKGSGNGEIDQSEFLTHDKLKKRIEDVILNNTNLDPDYVEMLRVYAKARGILD